MMLPIAIAKVFCLLMVLTSVKADENKIAARKLNLGSISDNSVLHYSHTINGNIYSFSVDYKFFCTLPTDVAKLTNKVANDLVEKIDFNSLKTKVDKNETDDDNLETKLDNNHLTAETSVNNLKTKVDGIGLTKYIKKSDYGTKVGNLEFKIPDVSGKLNTSDFNCKVSELENKIRSAESKPDITNLATKSSVTAVKNKIPDVKGFIEKTHQETEITSIKNNYVTNAAFTSQLNNLKSTHIADEVKKLMLK